MNLHDELRGVEPPKVLKANRRLVVNLGMAADEGAMKRAKVRDKNARYRAGVGADPEKVAARRAYQRAWRKKNAVRIKAARARWIAGNIEWWRRYQREWQRNRRAQQHAPIEHI